MKPYESLTRQELQEEWNQVQSVYARRSDQGLNLNIARGKPSRQQLDLVSGLLTVLQTPDDCMDGNIDARNYGNLPGLPSARAYWAEMLDCRPEQTFVGGASSLTLMYDVISKAYTHGLLHSPRPWCKEETVKFLCPSPGYDRHFRITESFGAELIPVAMTPAGPDMDAVERLVQDPAVKGIWCVPKYSNPTGIIYSDQTISRIAHLKPAAPDFAVMWDNAYCVHEFSGDYVPFPDILELCRQAGNRDMVYEFASTSKITFPGAGISVLASSEENIARFTALTGVQMICYDKVNQLRHVRYLQDKAHTLELMGRHAQILGPKFQMVEQILTRELTGPGFASWSHPTGGYFVSLDTMPGTAKRTLELCRQAGLTLTPAGAAYPCGMDPEDKNIRIAPSYPPLTELEPAMELLCICLRLAALEKLLGAEGA